MSADTTNPVFKNGILRWIDDRLPILSWGYEEFVAYPAPKNLNYWWNFGSLAGLMLVIQIVTGIVLVMQYTPNTAMAFSSVEHIMRDVKLRLAASLRACQRRVDVLRRRLHPHRAPGSTTAPTRRHANCCGCLGSSSSSS